MKDKRKKEVYAVVLVLLLVGISLGYAALSANLNIMGFSRVKNATWDIHFNNVVVNPSSVELSTGDSAATINPSNTTEVTYAVTLKKPGDFYEFTVDAVNAGTIDGMIESILLKMNGTVIDQEHPLPVYLDYTITYIDDIPIADNHLLEAGHTETYKVHLEFKKDIDEADLPTIDITPSWSMGVGFLQKNSLAIPKPIHTFKDDPWDYIASHPDIYNVGDTKTVNLGSLGSKTVKISNLSNSESCQGDDFSQSACGFVVEFVEAITSVRFNNSSTNVGGWRDSYMRSYLNNDFYNNLPDDLKNVIVDTKVLSSHGSTPGEDIFTTTDKIYLLSSKEVGSNNSNDNSLNTTRTLDYYTIHNSLSDRKKREDSGRRDWWLRSAHASNDNSFLFVTEDGDLAYLNAYTMGCYISPAFRVG